MKRVTGASVFSASFVLAFAMTACTESHKSAATPSATSDAGVVDAGSPRFVAWTDPAGVAALLRGELPPNDATNPVACDFEVPSQSCIPGPDAIDWDCKLGCATTCDGCAHDCSVAITPCRAACAAGDASCVQTCGVRAGACVQACLGARDRCYTGDCRAAVTKYMEQVRTNYGCKAKMSALDICNKTVACLDHCADKPDASEAQWTACEKGCKDRLTAGCNQNFMQTVEGRACTAFDMSP